ncbi:MAG: alanine racemase [Aestuariivirga sp.]
MTSVPEHLATVLLTVDMQALQDNWRLLAKQVGSAQCAAAVKGDAYGLGIAPVTQALWKAGCRSFFVGRPTEGEELRAILPQATIYVLDGLLTGQAEFYARLNLIPALSSGAEAHEWAVFKRAHGGEMPCALHVDTGINRVGFSIAEFSALLDDSATMKDLNVSLVMSHLACADEPSHPLNAKQRDAFAAIRRKLPGVPASLANSGGIFLGPDYLHDLVRPGIALYGGNPTQAAANPMRAVACLEAKVMQVRSIGEGESVGYGATWKAGRPSRIAVLGAGYRDGLPRAFSSTRRDGPAQVYLAGRRCPIVGRVSMDMVAIDVTDLEPPEVARGMRAEIFGEHISIDEAAAWAGTISYELLTRLGSRYARLYSGIESERPS